MFECDAMDLAANNASAYLIQTAGGGAMLKLDTTTSNHAITFGNATDNPSITLAGAGVFATSGALRLGGVIAPSALSANQNDWAPASLADAGVILASASGATRTITGIAGGASRRWLVLVNTGATYGLTLAHESGSSTAANRFQIQRGVSRTLAPYGAALLVYDGTASRWRLVAGGAVTLDDAYSAGGEIAIVSGSPVVLAANNSATATGQLRLAQSGSGDAAAHLEAGGETWGLVAHNGGAAFVIAEGGEAGVGYDRIAIERNGGAIRWDTSGSAAGTGDHPAQESIYYTSGSGSAETAWSFALTEDHTITVTARMTARMSNNLAAGYVRTATARRWAAGNVTLVGSVSAPHTAEDSAAWDCTFDVDTGTQTIRLRVTAENGAIWSGAVEYVRSKG
jgi:hypothetical protein